MSEKPRHPEKVNKPINPIKKKPDWRRSKIVDTKLFFQTKKVVNQNKLVTVCRKLIVQILLNVGVKNMQHL